MTSVALRTLVFVLAGVLLGLLHFASLYRAVRVRMQRRGRSVGLHSVRFAATTIGLLLVTRTGGQVGLLAAFVGFIAARTFATLRGRPA